MIVAAVIAIIASPAILIASKIREKKADSQRGDNYKIECNVEFIYDFLSCMESVTNKICESIVGAPGNVNPLAYAIDQNYSLISSDLSELKKLISEFDKKAYTTTTTILGSNGEDRISEWKAIQRKLNMYIKTIEKYNRNSSTEGLSDESKKHLTEFVEIMTNWSKKSSELATKLKEIQNSAETTNANRLSNKIVFDRFTENDLMDIMLDLGNGQAEQEKRLHGFTIFDPDNPNVKSVDTIKSVMDHDKDMFRRNKSYPKQVGITGYSLDFNGKWTRVLKVIHCKEVDHMITSRFGDDGYFTYDA